MTQWTLRKPLPIACLQVWVALLLGVSMCLIEVKATADENLKKQFLGEYEKPEMILKKKYSGVEITAIVTEKDTPTAPVRWSKLRFVAADKAIRLDAEQDRKDLKSGNVERHKSSIIVNPALASFFAHWDQSQSRFVLDSFAADHNSVRETIYLSCPFAQAPLGCFELTVRDLLDDKDVLVKRFEKITRNGEEMAELSVLKTKDELGKPLEMNISFVFDTRRKWAIKEFSLSKMRTTMEYEGEDEGVPKLKAMHRWHECSDGTRDQFMDVEVKELTFKKVPEMEFTLEAFGLGEKK